MALRIIKTYENVENIDERANYRRVAASREGFPGEDACTRGLVMRISLPPPHHSIAVQRHISLLPPINAESLNVLRAIALSHLSEVYHF